MILEMLKLFRLCDKCLQMLDPANFPNGDECRPVCITCVESSPRTQARTPSPTDTRKRKRQKISDNKSCEPSNTVQVDREYFEKIKKLISDMFVVNRNIVEYNQQLLEENNKLHELLRY